MRWWVAGLVLVPVAVVLEVLHAPPLAVLLTSAAALVPSPPCWVERLKR